jgi:hypothetical protein
MIVLRTLALAGLLGVHAAAAAPPTQDPDWPCVQRLVPALAAASYWNGALPAGTVDWHANKPVAALVEQVAPRDVPAERGAAKLRAFAASLPPQERSRTLPLIFVGLVDETNRQRSEIIDSLRALSRRQQALGEVVAQVTRELRTLPANATPDTRADVTQRRDFTIRQFLEVEHTTRYACEVPVELERRLGTFAQALQEHAQ